VYLKVNKMPTFAGPHTQSLPWDYQLGSVGKELGGCSTILVDADGTGNDEVSYSVVCTMVNCRITYHFYN